MQILTPFLVMMRARQLGRQFRDIERSVRALPKRSRERLGTLTLREIGQASRSDFPHLYGTAPEARYLPWGQGTEAGYERACSNNAEVALRGIALWLAVAYHETKNSPHASLQPQHRQLMQLLRELKEVHGAGTAGNHNGNSWVQESAVA
ncbi:MULTISPECIES: hypothetical protein [Rhodanobacter]|jgi:hypothetical protein|uniref:hypothetical protein n=1 Tax=Rhodanobacter TaxID=75309 RepID=UPI0004814328|nr:MULTISPECIES: hypothetical protein [Rhodanobacter]KZC18648.1 hypothetical protein RHOFW104R3_35445 [Rhodanobacter denitrificans]UJJ52374.1 hypothetical protein LRK52_06705 [Rhodanobacter denitrificans]UJM89309.1 hypothetical protein LRK24_12775 [Rhodanobacter denitrificans]UJM95127.1 hypothetical protein LRK32_06745 [Rhodanobacter denitrificans]UJM98658.1 hypothetical protein LRK44_06750 [Rhodanobacter denitrificans]